MADRRMISKKITDTDAFLEMPLSTQCLYFHLIQNADDDGFVGNPNTICRKIGANKNDLDLLIVKKFIIPFESGVIVIKHWKIHNYIQNDRYTPTTYTDEKEQLILKENKSYSIKDNISGYNLDTQYSIGKDSIDKYSIDNTICEVPETDTPQKEEIFIQLILNDKTFYDLPMSMVNQYEELYKAVDVKQEIRNASAWLLSNPTKRKTRRGILRFINGWLERKQNNGRYNSNQDKDQPKDTNQYGIVL